MGWMPGIPHDPSPTHGGLSPIAAVCHRTYGSWAGDYAVGKGSRGSVGFHFLVGKVEGQWVQFADTNRVCYHAKGANSWSVGIEVTGTNDDPFTGWQLQACHQIVQWLHATHGIPLVYFDSGRAGPRAGFVAHNAVAGSDHGDRWGDNWGRVLAAGQEDDMSKVVTSIAQRVVMRPDGSGRGLLLDCLGGVHSVGGQPVPAGAPYWGGVWDLKWGPVAVDIAVADWDGPQGVPTGWTVDCKGALHPWAGTAATSGPYWAWSPAVAELD